MFQLTQKILGSRPDNNSPQLSTSRHLIVILTNVITNESLEIHDFLVSSQISTNPMTNINHYLYKKICQ